MWESNRSDPWYIRGLVIHMPWDMVHVRHEVMDHDGQLIECDSPWKYKNHIDAPFQVWTSPYQYTLKNGTIQNRIATIYVEEREWRWRWFQWLPYPRRINRSISIDFDEEVGERTGSWKGGVMGCGYDLRKNEHPLAALKRMEKERIFD